MVDHEAEDHRVELLVGNLLRWGVVIAATVTALGGVLLLAGHGHEVMAFGTFHSGSNGLSTLGGILRGALAGESAAVVQLGVVLLIATPIARVAITLVAFLIQRDRLYALITTLVLCVLLYGLLQ